MYICVCVCVASDGISSRVYMGAEGGAVVSERLSIGISGDGQPRRTTETGEQQQEIGAK